MKFGIKAVDCREAPGGATMASAAYTPMMTGEGAGLIRKIVDGRRELFAGLIGSIFRRFVARYSACDYPAQKEALGTPFATDV